MTKSPHLNILFINYGDMRSNSMGHIGPYANELVRRGHSCSVAVETFHPGERSEGETGLFAIFSHKELAAHRAVFQNKRPADIIHAWTPRESVRELTLAYLERHPNTKLIIHLEDNEEEILESHYLTPFSELREKALASPEERWHPRLSHPVEYRRFLARADAVTLITPSLAKLLPFVKEQKTITPIIEDSYFDLQGDRAELETKYDLPQNSRLIVFPGGITSNNRQDIRNLYIAVHTLRERGHDLKLVKTGPSCELFERSFQFDINAVAVDLGYIERNDISKLIKSSDLLVQPGEDNVFNRDRFPCKLPEFFASGRPCIIPEFYAPPRLPDQPICLGLKQSTPLEIAQKIESLLGNHELAASLAANALNYAKASYSREYNTNQLESFYRATLAKAPATKKVLLPEELHLQTLQLQDQNKAQACQLDELRSKQAEQVAEIERSRSLIPQLEQELIEWKKRDERRRATFSWKITTPLRFLRRTFLDPKAPAPQPEPAAPSLPEEPQAPATEPCAENDQPPAGHRCYIKDYYKFVEREEWLRSIYVDKYKHPQPGPACPKISILLPVYNVEEKWLRRCIDSVLEQIYSNWELCIADDASTEQHIAPLLKEYEDSDNRIKIAYRPVNGHISASSNTAFELATGDYIALLDHDDELPPHALAKVVDSISEFPHAKLLYSDEDKIDQSGIRHDPHFKSDWNYDLLLGCNTISHLGVYRRDAFEAAGGFRVGYEGAQDWDLALRVIEHCKDTEIVHIPEVLYHWRTIETSTAHHHSAKNYAHEAQERAIADHLERIGRNADLISIDGIHWRVRYALPPKAPKVSILIPTKDRHDLISKCVDSILEKTDYENYEIVIINNQTKEEDALQYLSKIQSSPHVSVLKYTSGFNYSAINNWAASQTDSEIICLLNNDTEVINSDWLCELVRHTLRPEVGVVGAKLLYPDDHIQHAGLILGIDGVAKHAFRFLHKNDFGHVHRANLISQWSAVTGACMAVRRETWEKLGGLDEKNLAVAYNDVDFCLRAREAGLSVLLTPYSLLYHKESATRGWDQTSEQHAQHHLESAYMYQRWPKEIWRDPFYNPNFAKTKDDFEYVQ